MLAASGGSLVVIHRKTMKRKKFLTVLSKEIGEDDTSTHIMKNVEGIFDAVLKRHIDFESDPWPLISDSTKDLIRKMLCMRPSERLTAHEVLCHPWICENGVAPDRALDPAVLSHLKQFSAMNKLKKMALRVIAERMSEEEIAGLKEMFKAMDTDNSGAITFDELKAGLRKYGSTLQDTEIRDLMEAADVDNSGTIDYGEFITATIHLNFIFIEMRKMIGVEDLLNSCIGIKGVNVG